MDYGIVTCPMDTPTKSKAHYYLLSPYTGFACISLRGAPNHIAQWLKCCTAVSMLVSSNSSRAITFTFGLIPIYLKIMNKPVLALNNPYWFECHKTQSTMNAIIAREKAWLLLLLLKDIHTTRLQMPTQRHF